MRVLSSEGLHVEAAQRVADQQIGRGRGDRVQAGQQLVGHGARKQHLCTAARAAAANARPVIEHVAVFIALR